MNADELNIIAELQRNGFIFAGICKPCGGRARKYAKGRYMFRVYRTGMFKLYYQNQLISGYEPFKSLDKFIQRTQET
jgi:hypothetical protein